MLQSFATVSITPTHDDQHNAAGGFAFPDDFNAELDAYYASIERETMPEEEEEHYRYYLANIAPATPAPLTVESAIELLQQSFPQNVGVTVGVDRVCLPKSEPIVRYNVAVHLPHGIMLSRSLKTDLDKAVQELLAA